MKSVITCDMEGVIETINEDGIKLFGYSKEELVGKKKGIPFLTRRNCYTKCRNVALKCN